jgi:hypothetical protein
VWNGNIGTLIANPRKKARKHQNWRSIGMLIWYQWSTSKVPVWAMPGSSLSRTALVLDWKYRASTPSSITTDPTRV